MSRPRARIHVDVPADVRVTIDQAVEDFGINSLSRFMREAALMRIAEMRAAGNQLGDVLVRLDGLEAGAAQTDRRITELDDKTTRLRTRLQGTIDTLANVREKVESIGNTLRRAQERVRSRRASRTGTPA